MNGEATDKSGTEAGSMSALAPRKPGRSLGDWLNQSMLAVEETSAPVDHAQNNPRGAPALDPDSWSLAPETPIAETGRMADALAKLTARIAETDRRQAEALTRVDQTVGQLASRVDRTEEAASLVEQALAGIGDLADAPRRLEEIETASRAAAGAAMAEIRSVQQDLEARLSSLQSEAYASLGAVEKRLAGAENSHRALAEATLGDLERVHRDSEARIEALEAFARSGVSAAQAGVQEALSAVREAQQDMHGRLSEIEARQGATADPAKLQALDARVASLVGVIREGHARTVEEIEAIHGRIDQTLTATGEAVAREVAEKVAGEMLDVEATIARLAQRLADAETKANEAIRTLETKIDRVDSDVAGVNEAREDAAALRSMVEQRLDDVAIGMSVMVDGLRAEIEDKIQANASANEFASAVSDVQRRMAAAERRQANTIEAISIELKRMHDAMDRRLRAIEERNEDGAVAMLRDDLVSMSTSLGQRFVDLERRESQGFERVSAEMGRLSERFDQRFEEVESHSAQAIEHIGEQVARVAERLTQRQDQLAREMTETLVSSEERQGARLAEAITTISARIQDAEERADAAISPMQKALAGVSSRLQAVEDSARGALADFEPPMPEPDHAQSDAGQTSHAQAGHAQTGHAQQGRIERHAAELHRAEPRLDDQDEPEFLLDDLPEADDVADLAPELGPELSPGQRPAPMTSSQPDDAQAAETRAAPVEFDPEEAPPPFAGDELPWDGVDAPAEPKKAEPALSPEEEASLSAEIFEAMSKEPEGKRQDYLANARRAAQQAAAPQKRARKAAADASGGLELRGPNRIILWSAAGALAVAMAGGAYVLKARQQASAPRKAPPAQPPSPAHASEKHSDAGHAAPAAFSEDAGLAPVASDSIAEAAARANEPANAPPGATQGATQANGRPEATGPSGATRISATPAPSARINGALVDAANRGDAVAQFELSLQKISTGNAEEGVALLRRAANQGLAMAQYRLAKLYERGEVIPPDLNQARQWTERAAAAGNKKAMHDLGVYYARGEGAPLDEAAAYRWFRQAAELGVADSQFNLGVLFQQGRGVAANPAEALFWFNVAAKSGDGDARARALTLEAQLGADQATAIRARAEAFRPRPSSARANGEFGTRYWSGDTAQAVAPRRS